MTDTLQIDTLQLSAFQHDPQYDYDRDLMRGSQNLLEWLSDVVSRWLFDTFDVVVSSDFVTWLLVMLGILVLPMSWNRAQRLIKRRSSSAR